jgi:hypothetical protein
MIKFLKGLFSGKSKLSEIQSQEPIQDLAPKKVSEVVAVPVNPQITDAVTQTVKPAKPARKTPAAKTTKKPTATTAAMSVNKTSKKENIKPLAEPKPAAKKARKTKTEK